MSLKPPAILECTLRDGSYVVGFQFTAAQTEQIAGGVDRAAIPYIEVGHGVGLGAARGANAPAAATDAEYMVAAGKVVRNGKWGMFCIPGIGSLDDLRCAADHGMDFVRIGTDVSDVDASASFIELARELGIEVFTNFMKSYVIEPKAFGRLVQRSADYGSQLVYLVDSAGGMLPNEVRSYIQAAKAHAPGVPLGFHGHNNLGLAVANSLICVEEGVSMIDTSLQGLGRSGGNTPTEQFISCLARAGFSLPWDPLFVMDLGELLIRPLIEKRGMSSLDVVAGQALFHSSYMPSVLDLARKHAVDPRALIMEICQVDKVNLPPELAERLAEQLSSTQHWLGERTWPTYYGGDQ